MWGGLDLQVRGDPDSQSLVCRELHRLEARGALRPPPLQGSFPLIHCHSVNYWPSSLLHCLAKDVSVAACRFVGEPLLEVSVCRLTVDIPSFSRLL